MGVNVLPSPGVVTLCLCVKYSDCINFSVKKGEMGGGGSHAKTPIKSMVARDDN